MLKIHNPASIAAPISRFHHGVEVPSPATLLYISGQVGVRPDGRLAEGPRPQIEQAWRNVLAIVDSAGMVPSDLVKVTAYLTRMSDVDVYRDVRNQLLPDITTASTLLIVAGLAYPSWLVEIEAVAAVHIPEQAQRPGRRMGRAESALADFGKNLGGGPADGEPFDQ